MTAIRPIRFLAILVVLLAPPSFAQEFPKPFSPPCVEREEIFEFTERPVCRRMGEDRYEITFAVKGNCDVAVGIVDQEGKVVRHLGAGVLGPNAPPPFQKNSLRQTIYWTGKDDLDWYPKDPDKLRVRVMLGLKPVFDKRLGGKSPYNLPGGVMGLAVGRDAAYVLHKDVNIHIRKFDRNGKYLCSLVPPPASLPESKHGGMTFVEYEPGMRTVHGPDLEMTVSRAAGYLPPLDGLAVLSCQPAVVGDRLFFANGDLPRESPRSFLHYLYLDGSTDARGIKGIPLAKGVRHNSPRLAASPDGKRIYFLGPGVSLRGGAAVPTTCIYAISPEGNGPAAVWAGEPNKPGSDNEHFGAIYGIDCDAQGRVYATDGVNNRIQIFSPEGSSEGEAASHGKHLKTIPADRPGLICVHRKTGAIYVQHQARVEGRSVSRLTKFASFDDPKELYHADNLAGVMALDQWSDQPRLWLAMPVRDAGLLYTTGEVPSSVTVWQEHEATLEKVLDFEAEARKEEGRWGRWNGFGELSNSRAVCDPVREKLYYGQAHIFDLATGKYEGAWRVPGSTDDIAFDKYGYLHAHANPCFFLQGVYRVDPSRGADFVDRDKKVHKGSRVYPECPYDYGIEKGPFLAVLPVKDQPGSKGFQDGLGVNLRGDVAEECNISYAPKMEELTLQAGWRGDAREDCRVNSYHNYKRHLLKMEQEGQTEYSIRRSPGVALTGGTVWTFDRNGELRKECAVLAGEMVNGVMLDESLSVYFVRRGPRLYGDKPFLHGRGGRFGDPASKILPFTGTLIKTKPDTQCLVRLKHTPIPLDELPNRPMDVPDGWVEGVEWLYAGASPIVPNSCECPATRLHLDWYKRVYVPEGYRHAFAILDTNGNLLMRVGRYANFDSAPGGKDGCKPGEMDIGMTCVRYIGGTDNYLAFEDWGERLMVLKLNYEAEETVGIK